MLCKKCGYSNDDNNKFCQECGAPMGDTAPETQNANSGSSANTNTDFIKTPEQGMPEPIQEPVSEPAPTNPQEDFNPNPTNPNPINQNPATPNPVNPQNNGYNPNPVNPQNNGYNPNPVNPQGGYNPNMAGGNPNFNPNMPNGYPVFDPIADKNAKDAENLALWSMICGIASFFCCSFGVVLSILSIVFGVMAKNKGSTSKKATAGIVLGVIGLVLVVLGFVIGLVGGLTGVATSNLSPEIYHY